MFGHPPGDWTDRASEEEYWLSYADLLGGLLMVFALLLLTAFHTYQRRAQPVQDLLDTRREIVDTLRVRFADSDFVQVDSVSGSVRFSGQILFGQGDAQLGFQGQGRLRSFAADYLPILLGIDRFRAQLEAIVIEGHTNDDGPFSAADVGANYMFNLDLSQRRAFSVMQFLLEEANEYEEPLREYVTANGRSFSDLIYVEGDPGRVDKQASRRIEIRFRLNDEEVIREIMERLFFTASVGP